MTMEELSAQIGVSKQALYSRLRKAGIDLRTLKTSSGSVSDEGRDVIVKLFDSKPVQGKTLTVDDDVKRFTETIEGLRRDLDAARAEAAELAEKLSTAETLRADALAAADAARRDADAMRQACEVWTAKVEGLQAQVEQLTKSRDDLTALLDKQLDMTQRLLPATQEHAKRRGLFWWRK